jgi:hypothetical protein
LIPDYDSPWKEMLDGYFPACMAFFFPEAHADIDWSRSYESLDTELQQIVRDAALGTRLADKLMQVWRRDGVEQIVLVHTEIQGTRETDFAKRIYVYNYRLFDRYDRPVVSLAVLGDASPTWRPTRYEQRLWGCRVGISSGQIAPLCGALGCPGSERQPVCYGGLGTSASAGDTSRPGGPLAVEAAPDTATVRAGIRTPGRAGAIPIY